LLGLFTPRIQIRFDFLGMAQKVGDDGVDVSQGMEGYCWAISSAVAPLLKAWTTVSSVTRVLLTRITPSESAFRVIASTVVSASIIYPTAY
jgi:hypothetical protein